MPIKLYSFWRSSAAYRVRIALSLKNIEYELIPVDLIHGGGEQNSPEYFDINPQGLVPTLVDGDNKFHQSMAIIEYLDDRYPDPALYPRDPAGRAIVRGMAQLVACDIHPLNNLRVLKFLKHELSISKNDRDRWYDEWVRLGFEALENQVARHGSDNYCFGNTTSVVDVVLVPQVYNARMADCDLSPYPRLVAIADSSEKHPAFVAAAPDSQVDRGDS